jgi:hypothetical protein
LTAVPAKGTSLSRFSFSISTVALGEYRIKLIALIRIGKKLTDPDDLLETLLFANLKHDLLGVAKLVGRKSVTPVYKERNIGVPGSKGRGRNFIDWSPRKSEGGRLIERNGRTIQYNDS